MKKKRTIGVLSLIVVLSIISCDPEHRPMEVATPIWIDDAWYGLDGVVIDTNSGEPLSGVKVAEGIQTSKGSRFRSSSFATTDLQGRYHYKGSGSEPTVEMFRFVKSGYAPLEIQVSERAVKVENFIFRLDVELEPVAAR